MFRFDLKLTKLDLICSYFSIFQSIRKKHCNDRVCGWNLYTHTQQLSKIYVHQKTGGLPKIT